MVGLDLAFCSFSIVLVSCWGIFRSNYGENLPHLARKNFIPTHFLREKSLEKFASTLSRNRLPPRGLAISRPGGHFLARYARQNWPSSQTALAALVYLSMNIAVRYFLRFLWINENITGQTPACVWSLEYFAFQCLFLKTKTSKSNSHSA